MMNEEQIKAFTSSVLDGARPSMRRAIGDRTPQQYDKADLIAEGIASGVRQALVEFDLCEEEDA